MDGFCLKGFPWPITGFAIITWNNPKKLEKPWITKGFYTWQSLGLILSCNGWCLWWTPCRNAATPRPHLDGCNRRCHGDFHCGHRGQIARKVAWKVRRNATIQGEGEGRHGDRQPTPPLRTPPENRQTHLFSTIYRDLTDIHLDLRLFDAWKKVPKIFSQNWWSKKWWIPWDRIREKSPEKQIQD